ncbi:MAG: hypothetical protein V5783_02255 [Pontiella sp.]
MNKRLKQIISSTCMVVALMAITSRAAVDPADAAAKLADLGTLSVVAQANITEAAAGGDVDALAEASQLGAAVAVALAQSQESFETLEQAVAAGNDELAQSSYDDIVAALGLASDAMAGLVPDGVMGASDQQMGPQMADDAYDPVNIYADPSDTDAEQGIADDQFINNWLTGVVPYDKPATDT